MFLPTGLDRHAFGGQTAAQIGEIADRDGSVLIVPVGSVEQHGDHLPTATDTILVCEAVGAALDRLDDHPVLATPPVWSGYSPHHESLGGTLSGEFETLLSLLKEIVDSALANGFDAALFVNGHGGNTALIETAVSEVGRDHSEAEITGVTYFELAAPFVDDIRDSDVGGMAHGGEFETSLLLHLHPDLVADDRPAEYWDEPYDQGGRDLMQGGPLAVYREFEEYSASGAIGDPSLASAEKGEQLFDGIADELSALVTDVHNRNQSGD
jgi:creatinine amidohydrolase